MESDGATGAQFGRKASLHLQPSVVRSKRGSSIGRANFALAPQLSQSECRKSPQRGYHATRHRTNTMPSSSLSFSVETLTVVSVALRYALLLPRDQFGFNPTLAAGAELDRTGKLAGRNQRIDLSALQSAVSGEVCKPYNSLERSFHIGEPSCSGALLRAGTHRYKRRCRWQKRNWIVVSRTIDY